jgi:hypothetical protein
MSATVRYVGGPRHGEKEVRRGIPDRIAETGGIYWLHTFSGTKAVMKWEKHDQKPAETVENQLKVSENR